MRPHYALHFVRLPRDCTTQKRNALAVVKVDWKLGGAEAQKQKGAPLALPSALPLRRP